MRYFHGFNALRFYAAISVVVAHVVYNFRELHPDTPHDLPFVELFFLTAQDAVTLFFVLSGFLITFLLLEERSRTGNISTRRFYLRRVLRIFPLYFLILIIGGIIIPLVLPSPIAPPLEPIAILGYIFFSGNLVTLLFSVGALGHLWSISVEEQFYAVWSQAVRRFDLLRLCVGIITIKFIMGGLAFFSQDQFLIDLVFFWRFEAMAMGALAALALYRRHSILNFLDRRVVKLVVYFTFASFVFSGVHNYKHPVIVLLFCALCAMLILIIAKRNKPESKWLWYGGQISYGIYMWHFPLQYLFAWFALSGVTLLIVNIVATLIVAAISYKYFESPFLQMKDRIAQNAAPMG